MPSFFAGAPEDMGRVTRLKQKTFAELCEHLQRPVRLPLTRHALHSMECHA
jgi:hypothetical protein